MLIFKNKAFVQRTRSFGVLIGTIFGFSTMPALSQDTIQPVKWNLETCLNYAKENNIQLNSLRLNKKSGEQDALLARAAVLPDLYGSASQHLTNGNTGQTQSGINPSGSYGINSSWTLYQGGYLRYDIQQRALAVESANLNIMQQENDITLQITQYYLNILLDKESIVYAHDLVQTSTSQLELARRKFAAGSIARRDVVQLEAQLADDQYTLVVSQNAERQDLLSLKQVLQLPSETDFNVVSPDNIISQQTLPALSTVQSQALKLRPEVKNSELGVDIAGLNLSKALSGFKPSLIMGGSVGASYANSNSGYFSQLNNTFNQQLGLTLSVPLFTRRLNKTNVEKAKISIDLSKLTLKDTKTTLSLNIERVYINALNARSQYDAAAEALKYNQETYRIALEELRLGAANIFTYYQQRNLYRQAMQIFIQAKYNAVLTLEIYNFYNGEPIQIK